MDTLLMNLTKHGDVNRAHMEPLFHCDLETIISSFKTQVTIPEYIGTEAPNHY